MGNDPALGRRPAADFLAGGGEMGERIRTFDWSRTPLGPAGSWSPALRTVVRLMLANRLPMLLWWGPQYVSIYNDPYRPVLGNKHPWGLGRPVSECWQEIWHVLRPLIDTPFHGGPATWDEDILLVINRHGFAEETHWLIAYSPVPDESVPGGIGGVLATVHETTGKVVGERRMAALRDLGARPAEAKTAEEACAVAAKTLEGHPRDIPFALLYLTDADGRHARLAGAAGVRPGEAISPPVAALDGDGGWPLSEAMRTGQPQVVADLSSRFGAAPPGPWPDPPHTAVVLPVGSGKPHHPAGFLVAGLSPRLVFNDDYRGFLELAAGHVATAVANARAYEEERKRAEALAELDRAKTAFFSNVSHEFRTPLTLMLGPVEDLLVGDRVDLPPAAIGQLQVVNRNGRRLLKLVNTLLDFSRIEAGRVQAVYEPTDLAAYTAELASVFRSAVERAGLRLMVDCRTLPEPVYVDRDMWEKVVLNLLSNALKFTFEGGISVKVRSSECGMRNEDTTGASTVPTDGLDSALRTPHSALLTVRDTGTGIPPEEMPRLFERFHRVRNARGRSHEGSGIGLALVQELVRLHGGTVRAESVVGQGTTFTVTVPLGAAHLPPDRVGGSRTLASTATGAGPFVEEALRWLPDEDRAGDVFSTDFTLRDDLLSAPETGPAGDRPRVLVADDNADMRQYLVRMLAERYAVEAAADGAAALEVARGRALDLVLADVMMPRLDGFGLLRELRADPRTAEVPVILLSARAGEESRVEGLEAGADDYLVKPFSGRELLASVSAHLKMARLRREAREALRESEERFIRFMQHLPGLAWIKDVQGRYVYANETAERVFGRPRADLYGRTDADLFPPETVAQFRENDRRALAARSGVQTVETLAHPDGTTHYSLVSKFPILGPDGEPVLIGGLAIDVTDHRQAENALRQSEDQLRLITDATPALISYVDAGYRYRLTNRTYERWFGRSPESIRGRHVREVLGEVAWEQVRPYMDRALAGEEVTYEQELPYRDGGGRVVRVTYTPDRGPGGEVRGFVVLVTDLTDLLRAQAETAAVNRRLIAALEGTADAFAALDRELRVTYVNRVAEQLIGRPRHELLGLRSTEVFPTEQMREINERYLRVLRTGRPEHSEIFNRDVGRWIEADTYPSDDGVAVFFRDVTDRRRAEEAARAARAQLQYVADTMPTSVARCDRDGRFVWVNKAYAVRFGLAPEQLAGRSIREALGEEAFAALSPYIGRVLAGEPVDYEVEDPYPVVVRRWVHAVYAPTRDEAGAVDGWVAVVSDVTHRRQLEQALRESETRFRTFADAAPAMLWATEPDASCSFLSHGWYEFTGQTTAEALGFGWMDAVHPEDRAAARDAFLAACDRREPFALDYRLRRADAEYRWAVDAGRPRYGPGGEFLGYIGSVIDIHDRKLAEEALRASEVRFRLLAQMAPSMVWTAAPDGTITWVNDQWYEYCRVTPERNARGWPELVLHPDDRDRCVAQWTAALAAGTEYEIEVRNRRHDGVYRWFVTRAVPARGPDGRVAAWFGVTTDIHDLKELQHALKDADRRKDEFLATLAHELRNPLAPIRNAVQVFHMREPADPQLRAARDVIDRQVRHMVRLIDDLLDVSRITRGKLHLRKQRVELAAVLQMARETADPAIEAAGHELTVELPAEPVWLDADPTRLAQVFANLLTNAAKYTDRGGRVRLRAERDGDAVAVAVTDTGIGIPAEHLPRLFETFSQVAPARERSQGGLGIGLSLVRGLVEMHGGTVAAASPGVGRGSTFTVRLPVAPRAEEEKRRGGEEETKTEVPLSSSPLLPLSSCGFKRVLVIDDSRDAADSLAEVLRALGCEVRVAYDGPAGLAEAARFRPDAVVCDIGMPGMSGLEVARRLRADPALGAARLVAVTGWGQDDDRRRSREAGFDRHLTKPVDPAELHRALAGGVPVGPES